MSLIPPYVQTITSRTPIAGFVATHVTISSLASIALVRANIAFLDPGGSDTTSSSSSAADAAAAEAAAVVVVGPPPRPLFLFFGGMCGGLVRCDLYGVGKTTHKSCVSGPLFPCLVSPRHAFSGKNCRHHHVGPTCRRHVGDIPS